MTLSPEEAQTAARGVLSAWDRICRGTDAYYALDNWTKLYDHKKYISVSDEYESCYVGTELSVYGRAERKLTKLLQSRTSSISDGQLVSVSSTVAAGIKGHPF